MHGTNSNADRWFLKNQGPHTVLPLLLSDMGYEVWVCNNRGVFDYSGHVDLNPHTDSAYWDYDWLKMADEDLSAITGEVYKR